MLKKTVLVLLGLFLIFAGISGMIIFSVAIWMGVTDPEEMDLFARIIAIALILWWDLQSFAVVFLGGKCIVGFKNKRTEDFAPVPQHRTQIQVLRCPDCGASLHTVSGKRTQCTYCGKKFTVEL